MVKCMVIALSDDQSSSDEEVDLPVVPRIGEHVELVVDGECEMYAVVGVAYSSIGAAHVDVYVRRDCSLASLINRLKPKVVT